MNRRTWKSWKWAALAALAAAPLAAAGVYAADHVDSPSAVADPAGDITDLYAWMTEVDGDARLNLVLDTNPFAAAGTQPSTAVQYVFHVGSTDAYGNATTETEVLCQFAEVDYLECWVGDEYVGGDPSDPDGISSDSGALRVFSGLRNDPFFFELNGFNSTVDLIKTAAGTLSFDAAGCPIVDEPTSQLIVSRLQSDGDGGAAADTFAGANIQALVVQLDPALVTPGGPLLAVWASTHRAPVVED